MLASLVEFRPIITYLANKILRAGVREVKRCTRASPGSCWRYKFGYTKTNMSSQTLNNMTMYNDDIFIILITFLFIRTIPYL